MVLLARLAQARVEQPGTPVLIDELIALMWPGEELALPVAMNRLRVAVTTLRNLGLGDSLLKSGGGYLLDSVNEFELVVPMTTPPPPPHFSGVSSPVRFVFTQK